MKRQESFSTFSRGQNDQSNNTPNTVATTSSEIPIFEFTTTRHLGANQAGPYPGPSTFTSPNSSGPATFSESVSPDIPRGVSLVPTFRPIPSGPSATLRTRQLWEGTVTELRDDGSFVAVLADKTDPNNPDELAAFSSAEISQDELKQINVGSSFYWILGSERTPGGMIKNVSMVQFRCVPVWTQSKLKRAADLAVSARKAIREEL
jgi:hypothetical protein